ncbi:MAG: bifunctional DNA-binding transcriptional regulator/O6-methylguanine-DNA methyltransferase Ada [Deltaproteobacteria bacterium]|nr:bifunctional DNA-binding transcriptional regulator/O6-methylguanine-DNA methyltransferase Ada [Deltaproteobacteria bacterium]MBK8716748.1 bifunctional DNA-binding transcriptional regulator/O6-methylguanine-DNA methyltransferase Ada [Deltaproteobacteria bacterium]MBP7285285.1 bifunctional DNA-binding transcriptional regulator/O6-methylguanine-DNA methyltransferase Ada [Nannocystaceae bacterium]
MTRTSPRPRPACADATDPRWQALRTRDARADGSFVYAVRTTGVFCRPSCPARPPRPENVSFYAEPAAAVRAGFRPCKRCRPDGPSPAAQHGELVAKLCRFIEGSEEVPTLEQLAQHVGKSEFHTHRLFKAGTGLTPRAYAAAHRNRRVRSELEAGSSVTEAIHAAGFGSSSRFYETSRATLGMTPTRWRQGGDRERIRFAVGQCSLGAILVATTDLGVCAILIGDDPEPLVHDLERRFPRAELVGDDPAFAQTIAAVVGMVEAPQLGLQLPLDIRGTAFQRRVWAALQAIPPGETRDYTGIADALGLPRSARAVAQACAANPLAIAIPCHRVVRRDGDLAGYRWGIDRKHALLQRERGGESR